jgi:predicted dehydrogenase
MSQRRTRRRFLQETAAVGMSAYVAGGVLTAAQPSQRVRLGIIGCGNRGAANLAGVAREEKLAEIVALCDVDDSNAVAARKRFPGAAYYNDYRLMLDKQKNLDAVVVSTPDHHHAFAALPAMRLGKHVYCEKPLAHSLYEVRLMMEAAAKHKVVTQMGTQIHAENNYRRAVEIVQSGVLGPIRRVQVWCSKQPDGSLRAKPAPVPRGLHYDLWVGPAPYRPYPPFVTPEGKPHHAQHVHHHWRWWWEYGGSVLADMACHYMDLAHWALNLRTPVTVASTGHITHKGDNQVPTLQQADFEYLARGNLPAVVLTWYHGVSGPDLDGKVRYQGFPSGVLFHGDKGQLLVEYTKLRLLPEKQFRDFQLPRQTIPPSLGHHREWLEAIRTGGTTTCNFAYSGALAETVLLGNVAYHTGTRIHYDAATGRVTNTDKAAQFLRREYRKGWEL